MMRHISMAGVILVAALALCGVVAASSASAAYFECYLVSKPEKGKEGAYSNGKCREPNKNLLEGKWILALLLPVFKGEDLWCALIRLVLPEGGRSGEDGAFKDEKCTELLSGEKLNASEYTEVTVPVTETPVVLPNPAVEEPLLLTSKSSSAKNIFQAKASGSKFECKEAKSEASLFTSSYGTGTLILTGCESAAGKCFAPASESHGTIKVGVTFQLLGILPEKTLALGVAVGPAEPPLKITCGSTTVEVEGAAIGVISGLKTGEKVKAATLTFSQKEGIQLVTECDVPDTLCIEKVSLWSNFGKALEQTGEESTETLTVVASGKYKEGAAIDF